MASTLLDSEGMVTISQEYTLSAFKLLDSP